MSTPLLTVLYSQLYIHHMWWSVYAQIVGANMALLLSAHM